MKCPKCGNENPPKLKFCVNCGTNLENPQEINYEQVDMGRYHSEGESGGDGFRLGSGTFTINDAAPVSSSSDLYTAAELNADEEEFDFSSFDEPYIPKLDTGRVALPHPQQEQRRPAPRPAGFGGYTSPDIPPPAPMQQAGAPPMGAAPQAGGFPQPGVQPMGGVPPMGAAPQMGVPPQMGGMQQMGGVPPMGGVPGYGQPMGQPMGYPQPVIVGYDQNGAPIYGQPMAYPQPVIVGYDQNGAPIYGQPMAYPQPVIVGYDQNGAPIYGEPPIMSVQPMAPQNPFAQTAPSPPPQPAREEKRVELSDDFWEFFDGGKKTEHAETNDDFFGKHDRSASGASQADRLKRFEKKKVDYMNDTPLVDASALAPNKSAKFNKLYMKAAAEVDASELKAKERQRPHDIMGLAANASSNDLESYSQKRAKVTMSVTEEADAKQLAAYVPERSEAKMAGADRAVEATPRKKARYVDELDAIELPDYMQARKTQKVRSPEIPGLPEFYKK